MQSQADESKQVCEAPVSSSCLDIKLDNGNNHPSFQEWANLQPIPMSFNLQQNKKVWAPN